MFMSFLLARNARVEEVKVCVTSEAGKEAVVALHGKGDFFRRGMQPHSIRVKLAKRKIVQRRIPT
jgi:hypothetical protein